MTKDISGVVILYNPDDSIFNNINSYISRMSILYVIDNSECKNWDIIMQIKSIKKIQYIDNNGNYGIGYSLNLAANLAKASGFNWLLTMDQDSRFAENGLDYLIDFIENNDCCNIGIISPRHIDKNKPYKLTTGITEELSVMTSGNLINLEIYSKIGGFREDYFIDSIDEDYCLRLNKNGYKVLRINDSVLFHKVGNTVEYKIFFIKTAATNHPPIRKYYIMRNKLDLISNNFLVYPKFCFKHLRKLFSKWITTLIFENNKLEKQKYIFLGIIDFIRNRFGKFKP